MKPRLQSIAHAPPSLPSWQLILDDLGNPPARRIARTLGISVRTVYRYNRTGRVPRAVVLALFWLTGWGRSAAHTQAWNDAQVALAYVDALRSQVAELEVRVAYLLALGRFGAANDPLRAGPHAKE